MYEYENEMIAEIWCEIRILGIEKRVYHGFQLDPMFLEHETDENQWKLVNFSCSEPIFDHIMRV